MKMIVLCALAILSGCAPTITAMGPESLTLRYDPTFTSAEDAQIKADALCLEHYNKAARHILTEPKSNMFIKHATFACD